MRRRMRRRSFGFCPHHGSGRKNVPQDQRIGRLQYRTVVELRLKVEWLGVRACGPFQVCRHTHCNY